MGVARVGRLCGDMGVMFIPIMHGSSSLIPTGMMPEFVLHVRSFDNPFIVCPPLYLVCFSIRVFSGIFDLFAFLLIKFLIAG